MDYTAIIVGTVLFVLIVLVICFISAYVSKKRIEDIISELGLIQGSHYDVVTNNGNKLLNLTYDHISYGNKSQNGNINIYFIKNSKYRGTIVQKEVMIKYGNIWKIYRLDTSTSNEAEYSDNTL